MDFLENITVGKRVLDRSFLTGTNDFGMVERTSATISGVGDPVIPATDLKPQSHIHGFGPGRATVHPDLSNRGASA